MTTPPELELPPELLLPPPAFKPPSPELGRVEPMPPPLLLPPLDELDEPEEPVDPAPFKPPSPEVGRIGFPEEVLPPLLLEPEPLEPELTGSAGMVPSQNAGPANVLGGGAGASATFGSRVLASEPVPPLMLTPG
jgi:hypothetical protein